MPNVIVDEEYGTQYEKSRGGLLKKRRRFCAFAKSKFNAYIFIRNYIVQNYPDAIESLTVTEEDETSRLWHGECTFAPIDTKSLLKQKGLPEYSFSTKGGTAHITQSRKTVGVYPAWFPEYKYTETADKKKLEIARDENGNVKYRRGEAPNFHCGIGWNEENATYDGTDIIVPSWKSTVKINGVANEFIDANYLRMLRLMTGAVNGLPFDGMNRGECLFAGCDGTRKVQEVQKTEDQNGSEEEESEEPEMELVWDLTFEFMGAPNRRTWIDNIGYVKKRGWEYMHMVRRLVNATYNVDPKDIPEDEETDNDYNDNVVAEPDVPNVTPQTNNKGKTVSAPLAAYIEQVYPYADFRMLGFNSIVQ
ncbi:MAG: hypothetical protein LBF88_13015 [Planctomycetaceae bacterium]|jgi:hypothetical protein|nr:hypothetical protein [Planctomycetaceae bacterium]